MLAKHDQFVLFQNTMKLVSGLTSCFILKKSNLYDDEAFVRTIETMFGSQAVLYSIFASTLFDPDIHLVKLFISMMIFSTTDCTYYLHKNIYKFENIHLIQEIQDRYIQIAWKYLLYRYDLERAVKCFSNFIRCLFAYMKSMEGAAEVVDFNEILDPVIKKTVETLNINE